MELYGKRILLVGMARSGIAAAELMVQKGAVPVLNDRKKEEAFGTDLDGLKNTCQFRLGDDPVALLDEVDGLVISPGVPINAPVVKAAAEKCLPMVGELELAFQKYPQARVVILVHLYGIPAKMDEILEIKYRGKTIHDTLEMSVDDAITFFSEDKGNSTCRRIVERLQPLQDVGLGYIRLGQSSSTLSGGESQRVKLASFLAKDNDQKQIMFIFDEPTTGLHFHDIRRLLRAFNALIANGHTIVIVEHNMEVIKCADWVIDLGPEAGDGGGQIVFEGTPADLEKCEASHTGRFLREHNKAQ